MELLDILRVIGMQEIARYCNDFVKVPTMAVGGAHVASNKDER